MIRVTGTAMLRVDYEIELPMSEEQFDELSISKQNELIESVVDWKEVCRSAEIDDIEIDELVEYEEETK